MKLMTWLFGATYLANEKVVEDPKKVWGNRKKGLEKDAAEKSDAAHALTAAAKTGWALRPAVCCPA